MAIFISAIALDGSPLAASLAHSLVGALAPAGQAELHQDSSCAVAHIDLGVWPGASTRLSDDCFAVIAADPVLVEPDGRALARPAGIEALSERLLSRGPDALRDAEGTYAGLLIDRKRGRVHVFTDKLGVRPVYWARTDKHVFVSSTFWALHALTELALRPDWRAAAETAAFGFPMGDRTLVEPISLLAPGHCLTLDGAGLRQQAYWRWDELPQLGLTGNALLEHVEQAFHGAVDRRLQGQSKVMAFLSGGMDSRLITTRLRQQGARVHSLNFAPPGSQDLVFGRLVAEATGCEHFEYSQGALDFSLRQTEALHAWKASHPDPADAPEQPGLIWSGDGGSVGLGHVYLTRDAVQLAREKGAPAVARKLLTDNNIGLSPHLLRVDQRQLAELPQRAIEEDLNSRAGAVEPGRNCHLFFMLNDQRRHLAKHFETLHLRRVDFVLPFFDARFLTAVLANPVDDFLEHRLYNELMARLPMGAGQIPWQAYPGHAPCPIPVDSNLRRQWQDGWYERSDARAIGKALMRRLLGQVIQFPAVGQVLSRAKLATVATASLLGLRDYQYLAEQCQPFLNAAALADRR